ncbi:MAG TPA: protease inhibitor I42 family protein [Blastocatellia bacterium]|nr:protease inhibitor I42 family protein [Blastocatellia bacterium]
MRLAATLFACLMVFSAGALAFTAEAAAPGLGLSPLQSPPRIVKARIQGKKLIIEGEDFNIGAKIFLNGKKLKTKNDPAQPSTILIAKKGGKKIRPGTLVALEVKNPGGLRSESFPFFSGLTITLDDVGKTINLKVGERFMLVLKKPGYEWTTTIFDQTVIKRVEDASILPGAQGIFQAEQAGATLLEAVGGLECHKANPPCLAPSLTFEVRFVVEQ